MLEANKDKHFVAPGLGWLVNTARNAGPWGITPDRRSAWATSASSRSPSRPCSKMHKRGIRVLPGGDYGFAWTPHGTNAKDLEYFVDMVGMTPMEALLSRHRYGGEIMGAAERAGPGQGGLPRRPAAGRRRPVANIRILQDQKRILAVMKDGESSTSARHAPQRGASRSRRWREELSRGETGSWPLTGCR